MSVRGVMICETSASPNSITPSIISRASSSRRPSRCPSETMVRMSSSNDSSSGAVRLRPARRCRATSTTWRAMQTARRGSSHPTAPARRNTNGSAQSRAKVQGNQRLAARAQQQAGQQGRGPSTDGKIRAAWPYCQSAMPPVAAVAARARVRSDCMARPTCFCQCRTWPKRSGLFHLRQISSNSAGENSASDGRSSPPGK